MQWVDNITKQALAKKPVGKEYVVSDWKTPSGHIHIGSLRGVLIHDAVYKALKAKGKKTRFIFGFDDYDAMDKIPSYLPKSYEKYMGMPLSDIPSPKIKDLKSKPELTQNTKGKAIIDKSHQPSSYGEFYAREFESVYRAMVVESETLWTSRLYKRGKFNCAFDMVIENAEKIRSLYKSVSGQARPKDWIPVQMVCEKCGKIGTTRAYDYKEGKVSYICDRNFVRYTEGCGFSGSRSPHNGNAKFPWKVEWAAKWFILGTSVEGAGKDHQTKGGSHDLASAILREVFNAKPPVNIFYEWFLTSKGQKLSTSRGVGMLAKDMLAILDPMIFRFLILRAKPKSQVPFDLEGDFIPRLYDSWDSGQKDFHLRFSKVAFLIQMPHIDLNKEAEKEKGKKLTKAEQNELARREKYARIWLEKFASEEQKFTLQKTLPQVKLSDLQKNFIQKLLIIYQEQNQWRGENLHAKIHELKAELGIDAKEAFGAIYQIFLAKNSGPQAGWFLASLNNCFVKDRLMQALEK